MTYLRNRIKVTMTRVALHHLVGWLKTGIGDLGYTKLLMVGLFGRNYWCIGHKGEVNPRIGYQVGLKFREIDIQSSIKTKRGSNGRYDLTDKSVEIRVCWSLNVKITTADIVDCLSVKTNSSLL